jgi:excisionase family DNA binding protein
MSPLAAIRRAAPFRPPAPPPAPAGIVPRLLTVEQTAIYIACSKTQLWYWRRAGLIRAVRLDRRLRFDRAEIDALVDRALRHERGAS